MEELDSVLHFIANSDFAANDNPAYNICQMYNQKQKHLQKHEMDYPDFRKVLKKLAKDGYLQKDEDLDGATTYLLTHEGKEFIRKGGYKSSARRLKYSKTWNTIINVIIAASAAGTLFVGMKQCSIEKKTADMQTQIDTLKRR